MDSNNNQTTPQNKTVFKKRVFAPIIRERKKESEAIPGNGESTPKSEAVHDDATVVRVKRKRDESAMELLVVEDRQESKKAALESVIAKFAELDSSLQRLLDEERQSKQEARKAQRVYRLSHSIVDSSKVKTYTKNIKMIKSKTARKKAVAEKREMKSSNEDYVIDIYVEDKTVPRDSDVWNNPEYQVRLETFNEDLLYDNEYDSFEDYESEDSNAEDFYKNDYPDDEEDILSQDEDDVSDDDSVDDEGFQKRMTNDNQHPSQIQMGRYFYGIQNKGRRLDHDTDDDEMDPDLLSDEDDEEYGTPFYRGAVPKNNRKYKNSYDYEDSEGSSDEDLLSD